MKYGIIAEGKIDTPTDLKPTTPGAIDHGLFRVHEIGGTLRNLLHEISVHHDHAITDDGYEYKCGWVDEYGHAWDTYAKEYPLSVAN